MHNTVAKYIKIILLSIYPCNNNIWYKEKEREMKLLMARKKNPLMLLYQLLNGSHIEIPMSRSKPV